MTHTKLIGLQEFGKNPYSELVTTIFESKYFGEEENTFLEWVLKSGLSQRLLTNSKSICEGKVYEAAFGTWLKDQASALGDKVKDIKDKGASIIAKFGAKFSEFVKFLAEKIGDLLKKMWDFIMKEVTAVLNPKKVELAAKFKEMNFSEAKLKEEAVNFSKMAAGASSWLKDGIASSIGSGLKKTEKKEVDDKALMEGLITRINECIKEDHTSLHKIMIFEAGDATTHDESFLKKVLHKIEAFPPFSWLVGIEQTIEKISNDTLTKISTFLSDKGKVDGPYDFEILGVAISLGIGYTLKHKLKHFLTEMGAETAVGVLLSGIPGMKTILMLMYWIATGLFVVEVINTSVAAVA